MSNILATTPTPTTPKETKKVEKLINQEAKSEEKSLKSTQKDLDRLRKEERKAHKETLNLENKLEKMMKKEQIMLKGVHKAEHEHEIAVADLNQAKKDYQASQQNYEKMRETLQAKTSRVEEAVKENNEHSKNRNSKLSELKRRFSGVSGPSPSSVAGVGAGAVDGSGNGASSPVATGVIQTGKVAEAVGMPVSKN